MKITLKDLHEGIGAINELAEQKPSSAKMAYKLSRVVSSARAEYELLNKAQLDLLQKHGTLTDPQTGQWAVDWEKRAEFEVEWQGLLETEVEVWGDPIRIDDVDGQLSLSVDDYARLKWLFDGD